ncbi:MAG TPA: peptidyl-prolyl cis-trans isomerase [Vicinamibacterales bacterium]|jgi:peptidyl-prolyl cis-trans isomerase SurA|nr:peptidyl-prolyl cis-trans isomerase [Vicinamibacterales bacterium]
MKKQLTAALLLLALAFVAPIRAEILEQVLVKVNGDIITKTMLEQRQVAVLRQRLNNQVDADAMKNDEQLKKMLAEITPELLVNSVDELLMIQRGRELGLHLGDDQFKQVVANIRKEQGLEDDAKFQAALKQENMTMDDLRNQLERQMLIEQVQRQEIGSKLTITEEEAHQYYENHPDEFTDPSSITLREIFVEVPSDAKVGINVAQDEAGSKKAADARERLLKGEDFAKVAAEVSDSPSKTTGGLIGPFVRSDMSPQLQQLVDKMKPGDITPVIRSTKGYQVFKLESMTPQQLQPFDKVRDLIADKVASARTKVELRKFLARLRDQAIIEWKNDELKKAYEKQLIADSESQQ